MDIESGGRGARTILLWIGVASLVSACAGYVPGRQAYWDAQVREMCAKDGGVQVFETVVVNRADLELLGREGGDIAIPHKNSAHARAPVYAVNRTSIIREGNPGVWKSEWDVLRRSDGAILARATIYSRSGGDFPSPAYGTRFTCPDLQEISKQLQRIFIVEGGGQ